MNRILCALILSILLLAPVTGQAEFDWEKFRFYGTEWFRYTDEQRSGEEFSFLKSYLSLNAEYADFVVGIQMNVVDFENLENASDFDQEEETDFDLAKRFLAYNGDHFRARIGHYYLSLARNLALYIQRDDALNLDQPLDGGLAEFHHEWFEALAFIGDIERREFEPDVEEGVIIREYEDRMGGGRLNFLLPYEMHFGGTFVDATIDDRDYGDVDYVLAGGDFGITVPGDFVELYGEYIDLQKEYTDGLGVEQKVDGSALYATATAGIESLVLLVEYIDYENFDFRYSNLPSADREDEHVESLANIEGWRAKLDYGLFATDSLFYFSYGDFELKEIPGSDIVSDFTHWYGGIEQYFGPVYLHPSYGIRAVETILPGITVRFEKQKWMLDSQWEIFGPHSISGYIELVEEDSQGSVTDKDKSYFTYSYSPFLALTYHYARDKYPDGSKQTFTAWEISANPMDWWTISMLYGETPGGIICSGGVCREEPRFDGFKLSTTVRF